MSDQATCGFCLAFLTRVWALRRQLQTWSSHAWALREAGSGILLATFAGCLSEFRLISADTHVIAAGQGGSTAALPLAAGPLPVVSNSGRKWQAAKFGLRLGKFGLDVAHEVLNAV